MTKQEVLNVLDLQEYDGENSHIDHVAVIEIDGEEVEVIAYSVVGKSEMINSKIEVARKHKELKACVKFLHEGAKQNMGIYKRLQFAGISEIDNHCSDLYVRDSEKVREIISEWESDNNRKAFAKPFKCNVTGQKWLDIPFAYEPYYTKLK